MDKFKPPDRLSLDGDVAANWKQWIQLFELFIQASESTDKPDGVKIAMILSAMGPEGVARFNNFGWETGEDKTKYADVVKKFEKEIGGQKRVVFNRYKFWDCSRTEKQPFDEYLTTLKSLATPCDFLEMDNMLRDKIVFSTSDRALKEKMLRTKDLNLAQTIDLCRSAEITRKEVQAMRTQTEKVTLNALRKKPQQPSRSLKEDHQHKQRSPHPKTRQDDRPGQTKYRASNQERYKQKCTRCGYNHGSDSGDCPASGKQCKKCSGPNHFARMCKSRRFDRKVHKVTAHQPDSSDDEFFLDSVIKCLNMEVSHTNSAAWFEPVTVCKSRIRMKIDSGADTNTIPLKTWKKIKDKPQLTPSTVVLKALVGAVVEHEGMAEVKMKVNNKTIVTELYVTKKRTVPILGLKASLQLGLMKPEENAENVNVNTVHTEEKPVITMDTLNQEYSDVFNGVGSYPGKYHIQLKGDAIPIIQPPRRVPHKLNQRLNQKLTDMESQGIIARVDKPTEWVNNLVIAEKKDGSLRLCLDPRQLNQSICREHFQMPTFEEVVTNIGEAKVFTILDQKDSYWQVELDEESADLCTFNTPSGRYKFLRMPFGISSASEVLQKKTLQVFGGIKGVHIVADDMLIAAVDEKEHDKILREVLDTARRYNIKFNYNKTQLKKKEVFYMGVRLGIDGLKPDDKKIKAIIDMPDPIDKAGVQRLIGMLNFLSVFIPNKSSITAPLRNLLKEDIPWHWEAEQKEAMTQLKQILSSKPVLRLFDPKQPITVQADSSSTGLGACLLQNNQPVAYAPRALTEPETRWAQIEKELLAIVYAAEKFHQYICGEEVEVQSDHRPLETIFKKSLHKASPRIQVMLLRLLRYRLNVHYVPGSRMYIADTLSRAFLQDNDSQEEKSVDDQMRIHTISTDYPASPEKLTNIRKATEEDSVLQRIKEYTCNEWPVPKGSCPTNILPYWPIRTEIHEQDGLLFAGERLLIPASSRQDILKKLHEGHLGVQKCKSRAKDIMYWPSMSQDIEDEVKKCAICATYRNSNQKEPLLPHTVPERPWAKLGSDIFTFGGRDYLVVVDYFSKYPEVVHLENKTATGVIRALKPIFARHGIPDEFMSDNMPFSSHRFTTFAREWGFKLTTSSPRYPQSNGQSERCIQTVKSLMKKAYEESKEPHLALLDYRNSPVSGLKHSPAQLLMSRRLKDKLPVKSSLLKPEVVQTAEQDLIYRQFKQKQVYDSHAKAADQHEVGDSVRVQLDKTWDRGVITGKHSAPRSYYVMMEDGTELRRNSRFINKSPDKFTVIPHSDHEEVEPVTQGQMDVTPDQPISSSISQSTPGTPKPRNQPSMIPVRSDAKSPVTVPRQSSRRCVNPCWHKDYIVNYK